MARLTAENVQRAKDLISLYPQPRSALIPILHVAQEQDGWLTPDAMAHVAELLDLAPAEVYGTASFYDMFFTHPVGRYLVSVCTNLACLLNGAYELLALSLIH
ncbi:MAG: NAD(P)H-dependent oxidoreductase subunit E, partial [Actinomycetota bacterium]|nr:NAD(P)H-dependent oxidoreductase subunit E [Actinomycetota bacterium]